MHDLKRGKILVTGGAGFIGSALIWTLNERGLEEIYVTDCLGRDDKWRNLAPLRYADYIDADELLGKLSENENFLGEVTTVFHLGACSSTTEEDAAYLVRNNYEYTKFLAHWSLQNDARFIYASSAATYGDGSRGMEDSEPTLDRLRPLNIYGYSKHMFDQYAQRTGMLDKITGLKYFNIFGPNENHKKDMRSVVHKAFCQIRDTGTAKLFKSYHPDYKDGQQRRDFLYVKDAVDMTIHLAETRGEKGIFNIGRGEANTWVELITPIFASLEKSVSIEYIEMPKHLRPKYQYHTQADISKFRATGYDRSFTALSDAVTKTVTDHLIPDRRLGE